MRKLTFDTDWMKIPEDSKEVKYSFRMTEDFHVYSSSKNGDATHYPNPADFGLLYPRTKEAFQHINDFLKDIEEQPHFKHIWIDLEKKINFEHCFNIAAEEMSRDTLVEEEYFRTFAKLYVACFPIMVEMFDYGKNFLYDGYYGREAGLSSYVDYMSCISYKDLVETIFGTYRKDLARGLRKMSLSQIYILDLFSTILDADSLAKCMDETVGSGGREDIFITGLEPLRFLQKSVVERMLLEALDDDIETNIADTLEMVAIVGSSKKFRGAKTWREVHDRAMDLIPSETHDSLIELSKDFGDINSYKLETISLKPMLKSADFIHVGEVLDICIGKAGYYARSIRGEVYCFSVLKGDEVYGAVSVSKSGAKVWAVSEIAGVNNCRIPEADEINEFFEKTVGIEIKVRNNNEANRDAAQIRGIIANLDREEIHDLNLEQVNAIV